MKCLNQKNELSGPTTRQKSDQYKNNNEYYSHSDTNHDSLFPWNVKGNAWLIFQVMLSNYCGASMRSTMDG